MEVQLTREQEPFVRGEVIEAARLRSEEDAFEQAMSLWEKRERRRMVILGRRGCCGSFSGARGRTGGSAAGARQLAEDVKWRGRERLKAEQTGLMPEFRVSIEAEKELDDSWLHLTRSSGSIEGDQSSEDDTSDRNSTSSYNVLQNLINTCRRIAIAKHTCTVTRIHNNSTHARKPIGTFLLAADIRRVSHNSANASGACASSRRILLLRTDPQSGEVARAQNKDLTTRVSLDFGPRAREQLQPAALESHLCRKHTRLRQLGRNRIALLISFHRSPFLP